MTAHYNFNEFSRQSPKGIIVNYFTILYRLLKAGWAIILIILTRDKINYTQLAIAVAIGLVFVLIIAFLQFWFFQFKISDNQVIVKKGLIKRTDLSIQFERIQNIGFKQNIVQQIINVSQVNIETAGAKSVEVAIKALDLDIAKSFKSQIMDHLNPVDNEQASIALDEEEEKTIFKLSFIDLIKVSLTENHFRSLAVIVSLYFSVYYQFENLLERFKFNENLELYIESNMDSILGSAFLMTTLIIFLFIVSIIVSFVRTFLLQFDLSVKHKGTSLEIGHGLLTKRNFILKKEKVQYLTIITNPLKKILGINNIAFRQISSGGEKSKKKKQIYIVGAKDQDINQLYNVVFDNKVNPYEVIKPNSFFILIMVFRSLVTWTLINFLLVIFYDSTKFWFISLVMIPIILGMVYLKFKKLSFEIGKEMLNRSGGQIETTNTYFQFHKIQGLQLNQSIFQKRRNLISMVIQTASGKIKLPYIENSKALKLYNYLLHSVEISNKRWM